MQAIPPIYTASETRYVCGNDGTFDGCWAGDKPELLYPEAARELRELGCDSTLEYVAQAAAAVLAETGLLPHINAGTMGLAEVRMRQAPITPRMHACTARPLCLLSRTSPLFPSSGTCLA